jgi:hypothetical protein
VNLISLPPRHESLRDTIFYQIFQNAILVETERDLVAYRSLLLQNKVFPLPNLYSLDGFRSRGDGLVHVPPSQQDRLPGSGGSGGRLDFVFGESSLTDLTDFRNLDRELAIIAEMKQWLCQEAGISSTRGAREVEIAEIRGEIERIESKYGTRVGTGTGSVSQHSKIKRVSEMMSDGDRDEDISPSERKRQRTRK